MSLMTIASETLTSIANAIRAKTGKTAQMTPAEMVTEIGSISSEGSPTYEWKQLAEYTANESVHAIKINATPEMLEAKGLMFNCNINLTKSDYIFCSKCPGK